jgi:hypothetical protein
LLSCVIWGKNCSFIADNLVEKLGTNLAIKSNF